MPHTASTALEAKRPGPVITFVQGIDSESTREPTLPGVPGGFLWPSLPFVFSHTPTSTVDLCINSPQETPGNCAGVSTD